MLKDKRVIAVLLIALAVVVVLDIRYFINRGKKHRPRAAQTVMVQPQVVQQRQPMSATPVAMHGHPQDNQAGAPLSPAHQVSAWRQQHPLAKGARNPFAAHLRQPAGGVGTVASTADSADTSQAKAAPPARLRAIAMVDGAMVAIIDGEPVIAYQQVGNLTVENIDPNRVTVRQGASRWAESLPPLPADGINIVGNR